MNHNLRFSLMAIFFLAIACKKEDANQVPQIEFSLKGETERYASINDTVKANWDYYINVYIIDEEQYLRPTFMYDGDTIPMSGVAWNYPVHYWWLSNPRTLYGFSITEHGDYTIRVIAEDSYGGKWYSSFSLHVLKNRPPIVDFEIKYNSETDSRSTLIDASKTRDYHEEYGGEVIKYEYTITEIHFNGYQYQEETDANIFGFTAPDTGTFAITVRAMDNEGAWSEPLEKQITFD